MKPVDPTTLNPGDIINLYVPEVSKLYSQCRVIKASKSRIITDKMIASEPFEAFPCRKELPHMIGSIIKLANDTNAVRVLPDSSINRPTVYQWLSYDYYGNARPMTSRQISEYDWTTHQP